MPPPVVVSVLEVVIEVIEAVDEVDEEDAVAVEEARAKSVNPEIRTQELDMLTTGTGEGMAAQGCSHSACGSRANHC